MAERRLRCQPPTLRVLIRDGARRFRAARLAFGHGIGNAFDEAAYLALNALRLPPDNLASVVDRALTPAQARRVLALFERRIQERRPAAYLTREAWLGGHRFYVDERAIVPRSYIAELLQDDLAPWIARPQQVRSALDLCTGSGCLAIMMAHAFPKASIDAADLSAAALRVARRNITAYKLGSRVRLVRSNLFAGLQSLRYDLIVSNPPYVRTTVMQRLPQEYRHEPALALAGGTDGLDLIRVMLNSATRHLSRRGLLVVEVGHSRSRVEKTFPRLDFIWPLTSGGDDCVFVLSQEQLCQWQNAAGAAF